MTVTIDRAEASDANSVSNPRILTLAILSDLHAYDPRLDPNYHGHLQVTAAQSDPFRQPFAGLYRLIDRYELTADVVLCAGDMTNQANPVATAFAWSEIHRTAKKLEANLVLGAVGNHDWDQDSAMIGIQRPPSKARTPLFRPPIFRPIQSFGPTLGAL